jgi:hypothetical protein
LDQFLGLILKNLGYFFKSANRLKGGSLSRAGSYCYNVSLHMYILVLWLMYQCNGHFCQFSTEKYDFLENQRKDQFFALCVKRREFLTTFSAQILKYYKNHYMGPRLVNN